MPHKLTSIDEYIEGVRLDQRAALEALRRMIRSILPKAEECISYRIPAFRLDGKVVAGFAATSKGGSYYPFSARTLRTLAAEVAKHSRTKSALHFTLEKPLPASLVRKLIKTRIAEARGPSTTRRSSAGRPVKSPQRVTLLRCCGDAPAVSRRVPRGDSLPEVQSVGWTQPARASFALHLGGC